MKTIGIIGGMGPEAAMDLAKKILNHTPAKRDQEHIPVLIYNNTAIPDRTEYLLGGGEDPTEELIHTAKVLEGAGAELLLLSCNTAHAFYEKVQAGVKVPILNMIDWTAKRAKETGGQYMLLATQGSYKIGLYERAFQREGVSLVLPEEKIRQHLMHWIYDGVKAGKVANVLPEVEKFLDKIKGFVPVLACTELPLLFDALPCSVSVLDPTDIVAEVAVKKAVNG